VTRPPVDPHAHRDAGQVHERRLRIAGRFDRVAGTLERRREPVASSREHAAVVALDRVAHELVGRATRSASARSDLLPTCLEVEAQADDLDRSVGSELADDGEARDEEPSGDEDPVVGPARDQLGHGVELQGELVDHAKPFVDLEVVGGRFAVRTPLGRELTPPRSGPDHRGFCGVAGA